MNFVKEKARFVKLIYSKNMLLFLIKVSSKMNIYLAFLIVLFGNIQASIAQSNCLEVPIICSYLNMPLVLEDTSYTLQKKYQIKFESFKFYLSNIKLIKNNIPVWMEDESFHLIDAELVDSNKLCLNIPEDLDFDAIQFNLGIDSVTNVSGALGGDLDPTRGMYWTWQNGYINLKLQGTSNLCNNPKNEFEFHLGGYLPPFSNVQKIKLAVSNTVQFGITFNLDQFVNQLDLENVNHLMSPSQLALEHAQLAAKCFSIK